MVFFASGGLGNSWVAELCGCAVNTVEQWRSRYLVSGLAGLADDPWPGRPRRIDRARVVFETLKPPPKSHWATHWSTRRLAKRLGISNAQVADIWAGWGVQLWRRGMFKFSTDPELEAKVVDVVGLYLDPPEKAIVLSLDEKSQIQALDRTRPLLPMTPGKIERGTADYVRHGTTTLFAALNTATGHVTSACKPRHRAREFPTLCKQVARAYPTGDLHIVMDNYSTHKHKDVQTWLAANPSGHLPLHTDPRLVNEPSRNLLRDRPTPGHQTRRLQIGPTAHRGAPGLRRPLQQRPPAIQMGQNHRTNPPKNQTTNHLPNATLVIFFLGGRAQMRSSLIGACLVGPAALSLMNLVEIFAQIADPCHRRGVRHQVGAIVAATLAAVACGARWFAVIG
jgi:transposase